MARSLAIPGTATPHVELTCLQGLADLESLEGPWLKTVGSCDPQHVATVMRLLLVHLAVTNKRLVQASVLDRLDKATASKAVGGSESGLAPQNGTTFTPLEGTQGIPPTPSTQS